MKPVIVNNVLSPLEKRGMKRKTIIQNINQKMDRWLKSISDETLREKVRNSYILTGGAITSMLLGDMPNDYDVYLDNVNVALELAEYYLKPFRESNQNKMIEMIEMIEKIEKIEARTNKDGVSIFIKSAGILTDNTDTDSYEYLEQGDGYTRLESFLDKESFKEKKPYSVAMLTSNAISLHGNVQIILRFVGEASVIHENYDFLHVKNYYTVREGLVLNHHALEAILSKTLIYVGSKYPICTMFRIKKFLQRGWSITAGEMLKIAFDINKLDLEDRETFYDQLCGCDATYFTQLIDMLKTQERKDLDRSFLFEMIEKVFNEVDLDSSITEDINNFILQE